MIMLEDYKQWLNNWGGIIIVRNTRGFYLSQ